MELVKMQSKLTPQLALQQPSQISGIRKDDPDLVEDLITVMISMLADSFNVKANFSDEMIYECALLIVEEYWFLRPEEIMLAFKNAKKGKYGPVYNKLDVMTIMDWLHQYNTQERQAAVDEINKKKKENEEMDLLTDEDMKKVLEAEKVFIGEFGMSSREYYLKQAKEKEQAKLRKELEFREFQAKYWEDRRKAESIENIPQPQGS